MDSPRLPSDRTGSQICHCAPPGGESPPDLSLRGSAGAVAISQYTPGTQESPGEIVSACLRFPRRFAPRNDTGGRHSQVCPCAPPGEAGYQICYCEAPQEPRQSRSTRPEYGKASSEFAGAYLRLPRRACALLGMTREEGTLRFALAPLRVGKAPLTCHCEAPQEPWQSRSTRPEHRKAIGESATASPRFPRRFAPRNDKLGGLMP